MIRETYITCDPTDRVGVIIETDPTLPEVEVTMLESLGQPIDGASLDASQVGAIIKQLTTWLAERAR